MGEDNGGPPADALEDIAYLGRSANRVHLLGLLSGSSFTRSELSDSTDIARTTVGRIVKEFEERGWVERTADGAYTTTPIGNLVVGEFMPLVRSMQTIEALGEAAEWLPVEELDIGLQHFGDATIRRGAPNSPLEFVEYQSELIRDATTFQALTFLAPPAPVSEAIFDGVIEGRLTTEQVLAGGLVGYLRDQQTHRSDWGELIQAGARIYRYEGHIPCNLFIVDETVQIMNDRPAGGGAAVEIDDETVCSGVRELFEAYKEDAERVDAEVFA